MSFESLRLKGISCEVQTFLGQTTLRVDIPQIYETLAYLKDEHGYKVLMDLTGVDYLHPSPHTKVVYWLHNPDNYQRVRITVNAKRELAIPSVVSLWGGAAWYERELYDLFGVKFDGHENIKRILMPDDWVGHPLRKDYPLTEEPVEFKHCVKPKVPSEIIPHVKANKH